MGSGVRSGSASKTSSARNNFPLWPAVAGNISRQDSECPPAPDVHGGLCAAGPTGEEEFVNSVPAGFKCPVFADKLLILPGKSACVQREDGYASMEPHAGASAGGNNFNETWRERPGACAGRESGGVKRSSNHAADAPGASGPGNPVSENDEFAPGAISNLRGEKFYDVFMFRGGVWPSPKCQGSRHILRALPTGFPGWLVRSLKNVRFVINSRTPRPPRKRDSKRQTVEGYH